MAGAAEAAESRATRRPRRAAEAAGTAAKAPDSSPQRRGFFCLAARRATAGVPASPARGRVRSPATVESVSTESEAAAEAARLSRSPAPVRFRGEAQAAADPAEQPRRLAMRL